LQGSQYVARFDGESWMTYKAADAYPGPFVVGAVTSDGLVWGIVPERGVARFDGGSWADAHSWTLYDTADGLPSDRVIDLVVAPDDAIWGITDGGIARFGGGDWEGIPFEGDLGTVRGIAFAPDGSIWLGTTRGAVHLRP
jgi:ligand-binding sensor domain-containing protein